MKLILVPHCVQLVTHVYNSLKEGASIEAINDLFKQAAANSLNGIVEYCDDPIVSVDIVHTPHSVIFDSLAIMVKGNTVKVLGWYDNEWGYANRTVDVAHKLTLRDIDVRGLRVVVRVDFNVPLSSDPDGTGSFVVADDTRIRAALPTINALSKAGANVILLSHLGRPKGTPDAKFSLAPVAAHLDSLAKARVLFAPDSVGRVVEERIGSMRPGDILLLENTRFHAGETKNDLELARQWAALGDIFVNDAFGTAHRAHASNVGIASLMERSVAGMLLARELDYLIGTLTDPPRPFVSILGGAKVSDKIGVIKHLEGIVDSILIGGAMSYTFLKSLGNSIGISLVEESWLDFSRETYERGKIMLPTDHVTAERFGADVEAEQTTSTIAPNQMGLDIGPKSRQAFRDRILAAKTIVWNGPMGVFENPAFAAGTVAVAEALAEATSAGARTIVGGGDSVAAIQQAGCADRVTHISTGGGAMLACLEGTVLPGLAALTDRHI